MHPPIPTIFILFCLTLTLSGCAEKKPRVVHLLCESIENPLAVERPNPLLSWQLSSNARAENQSAYRIIVAGHPSLLKENRGDYWDSGKTPSSASIQPYGGRPLPSRTAFYWKVMIWNDADIPSAWSDVASGRMGLLAPTDWQAQWIGQGEDPFPDTALTSPAPYFRKTFTIPKSVKKALAYVSGLGFYELYVNGERIGDQVLAPAVTNYDTRSLSNLLYPYEDQSTQRVFYNVWDITPSLQPENNAIGILLGNGWYNQRDRTIEGHMWYDIPKLIFQLHLEYDDGTTDTLPSDHTWKTSTGPLLHHAIFTGEVYDARLELDGWNQAPYNDTAWQPAIPVRPPTGSLKAQTVPFNRVMETVATDFEQQNDSMYTFTLPETISGWCALHVQGKRGDRIKLRFITEEGLDYGQTDTYLLKGGDEEHWEPRFTWHTFRTVEATTRSVALSPHSITVKNIYTDVSHTGQFECSNELFNRIHRAWIRTMHANLKGLISSDPHRERLAYTGDGQAISESLLYSFDMTRLLRKFIDDMADAQNETGYVPHTAPFGGGGGGPAWGSASVIVPWNYVHHYGDTTLWREHYAGMKRWVHYLTTRTDHRGLIVREEPGGWCLGDWCTPYNRIEIPPELVNTAFYYHITSILAKIAETLNHKQDTDTLNHLAQQIKHNFNTAFYHPDTHHYGPGKQGADVLALAFQLVPEENKAPVFAALLHHLNTINYHFDTGIFGTPLTLQVLTDNGRADLAYRLLNQTDFPSYGYLMNPRHTTLWETWDGGVDDPNGSGRCHPMFGSVVAWFYRSLAGIRPDPTQPGMKHFRIEPTPVAGLTHCKASYQSLYGRIRSEWRVDPKGRFKLTVEIPANTSATVTLPPWGRGMVLESGLPLDRVRAITVDKGPPVRMEVPSGVYHFTMRR